MVTKFPHQQAQKNRPKGRLKQFSSPRFREVLRTLASEEEPVNPTRAQQKELAPKAANTPIFWLPSPSP